MNTIFIASVVFFSIAIMSGSLYCIYRNVKFISYIVELLILTIEVILLIDEIIENSILALVIFGTYLAVKFIILIIVIFFEIKAFYWAKDMANENAEKYYKKYGKKRFSRFVSNLRKIDYGPRLKLGVPAMVNKKYPKYNIMFDSKGFPEFEVLFEMKLKRKDFKKTRDVHFSIASKELAKQIEKEQEEIKNNPKKERSLTRKFTKIEYRIFKKGKVPEKYTWHHHQDFGKMQLVKRPIHSKVSHKGGYFIWGKRKD